METGPNPHDTGDSNKNARSQRRRQRREDRVVEDDCAGSCIDDSGKQPEQNAARSARRESVKDLDQPGDCDGCADHQHRRQTRRQQICRCDAAKDQLTDAKGNEPAPPWRDRVDCSSKRRLHIQSICHDLILVDEPGAVVSRSGDQPRRRRRRHLSRSRPTLPIRTMRHPRKRRTIASVLLRNWNSDLGIPSTATFVGSVNVTLRRSLRLIFMSRRHCTSFALETTGSRRNERDQIQTKR